MARVELLARVYYGSHIRGLDGLVSHHRPPGRDIGSENANVILRRFIGGAPRTDGQEYSPPTMATRRPSSRRAEETIRNILAQKGEPPPIV